MVRVRRLAKKRRPSIRAPWWQGRRQECVIVCVLRRGGASNEISEKYYTILEELENLEIRMQERALEACATLVQLQTTMCKKIAGQYDHAAGKRACACVCRACV